MYTITVFIRDPFAPNEWLSLGQGKFRPDKRSSVERPTSTIYICPACAEAWGKVQVASFGWLPRCRLCPQHGPGILYPPDPFDQYEMPKDALRNDIFALGDLPSPAHFHPYTLIGDFANTRQGKLTNVN